ncbi:DUF6238 family protein [Streptomyces sp. NPDC059456]|uniref:DUF6238 family protein n=1 Tax=Streptomyces sp. NPDC059456 TaxID=3346838 RepID=UPI0036CA7584
MTPHTQTTDAHPYLRAATAGIRHHTRSLTPQADRPRPKTPADRAHLDVLHAHLTTLHQLLDQLTDSTRSSWPAAGRHLATAHTRLWQASAEVHDAFHTVPPDSSGDEAECRPDRLPDGPPVLTICHRHLATGHAIRRKTTPADLRGHTAHSGR